VIFISHLQSTPSQHFMTKLRHLLDCLNNHLPRIAEEGNYSTSIPTEQLIKSVIGETNCPQDYCRGVLELLAQHWVALGLLDREKLKSDEWQFQSFPASLMARGMLDVLSWKNPQLESSEWWQDTRNVDLNREVLADFEERRANFSDVQPPKPTRKVQAAWALIKLEGRLLFNLREDGYRSLRANFVPIGGKLNLEDLESAFPDSTVEERLEWQQNAKIERIDKALEFTLKRELVEELKLRPGEHYAFRKILELPPFQKLDGGRANHAHTLYHIQCYFIELTEEGFRRVCRQIIGKPEEFLWATPTEITRGKQGDRRLYVDALRKGIGPKPSNQFKKIPESIDVPVNFEGEVDLPCEGQEVLLHGRTGQEQRAQIELSKLQIELLQGLGWHRLHSVSHPLSAAKGVILHPKGWIEIAKELKDLRNSFFELGNQCERAGLPILEGDDSGWFRLSANPGKLYFGEPFFRLETVHPDEKIYQLCLHVDEVITPIGKIPRSTLIIDKVIESVYKELGRILSGEETMSEKDLTSLFKQYLTRKSRPLGLRIPIRHKKGRYFTNCN